MRASISRIDLTTDPVGVEFWPSFDWPADDEARAMGPHGPSGPWDAMANAVQRVREVSLANDGGSDAEILAFAPDAPHLAYLARLACSADGDDDRNHLPGADVIALVDLRARQAR